MTIVGKTEENYASFLALFNARSDKAELIEKMKEVDEEIATALFEDEDILQAQDEWLRLATENKAKIVDIIKGIKEVNDFLVEKAKDLWNMRSDEPDVMMKKFGDLAAKEI